MPHTIDWTIHCSHLDFQTSEHGKSCQQNVLCELGLLDMQ